MSQNDHSSSVERALTLAQAGSVFAAYEILTCAESANDGLAALALAEWRLAGNLIRRDLSEARRLFNRAFSLGIDHAELAYIALLANGAGGCGRDWAGALEQLTKRAKRDVLARHQVNLLVAMNLDEGGNPVASARRTSLCTSPIIECLPSFLTRTECDYLVQIAAPLLQPAVVVHPITGQMFRDRIRTARSAAFPLIREDPVVHAINRRIAAATCTNWEQGEPLQILWYESGEEYKLHSDALPPGQNQRTKTFLVALNADYCGGETSFPQLELNWRGKTGDGLNFANVDSSGNADLQAWHAGQPVQSGKKLLLSKWLREKPLDLAGPPGRPF